jgi:WD40 repeat protein
MNRYRLLLLFAGLLLLLTGCGETAPAASPVPEPEPRPVHVTITGEGADMNIFDPLYNDLLPEWEPTEADTDPGFEIAIATTVHRHTCTYANYSDITITWIDADVTLIDRASNEVLDQGLFAGSNPGCPDRTTGATAGDPDVDGIRSMVLGQLSDTMGYQLAVVSSTHARYLSTRMLILSPDGTRLLAPRDRGEYEADLLDAATLETLALLRHDGHFRASTFSPDSSTLATVDKNGVQLVDATTGAESQRFPTEGGDPYAVGFSPDGARLMASAGHTVYLWDRVSGDLLWQYTDEELLTEASYTPGGTYILVKTSLDQRVLLLEADSGDLLLEIDGYQRDEIDAVVIGPDERYLATITSHFRNNDGVAIWRVPEGEEVALLAGEGPYTVTFSPDGQFVMATYTRDNIRLWRTSDWSPVAMPPLQALNAFFTPDSRYLILDPANDGGDRPRGDLRIYDTRSWAPVYWLIGHSAGIYEAVTSPDQTVLYSAGSSMQGLPAAVRRWEVPHLGA